ncbi:hypothetical protein [Actinomadura hibisca]|uniref:hypothetical protein n=1 Tax=Actinomadura hibisca TaxID=68565 RepID=UPI000831D926|nr:hypothetical protein [Actinomadura hibisca]
MELRAWWARWAPLAAIALLTYLVAPNQLVPPTVAASAGLQAHAAPETFAGDSSRSPGATSDDVTVQPRAIAEPHPVALDRDVPWAANVVAPGPGRRGLPRAVDAGVLAALRPSLNALQVLRC